MIIRSTRMPRLHPIHTTRGNPNQTSYHPHRPTPRDLSSPHHRRQALQSRDRRQRGSSPTTAPDSVRRGRLLRGGRDWSFRRCCVVCLSYVHCTMCSGKGKGCKGLFWYFIKKAPPPMTFCPNSLRAKELWDSLSRLAFSGDFHPKRFGGDLLSLSLRYAIAFLSISGSSLNAPSPVLHLLHVSPPIAPVS